MPKSEIAEILKWKAEKGNAGFELCEIADRILALPALVEQREKARKYDELLPLTKYMEERAKEADKVIADAEKWRRVKEIADTCVGCPLNKCPEDFCTFTRVVDALTEGKELSHDNT